MVPLPLWAWALVVVAALILLAFIIWRIVIASYRLQYQWQVRDRHNAGLLSGAHGDVVAAMAATDAALKMALQQTLNLAFFVAQIAFALLSLLWSILTRLPWVVMILLVGATAYFCTEYEKQIVLAADYAYERLVVPFLPEIYMTVDAASEVFAIAVGVWNTWWRFWGSIRTYGISVLWCSRPAIPVILTATSNFVFAVGALPVQLVSSANGTHAGLLVNTVNLTNTVVAVSDMAYSLQLPANCACASVASIVVAAGDVLRFPSLAAGLTNVVNGFIQAGPQALIQAVTLSWAAGRPIVPPSLDAGLAAWIAGANNLGQFFDDFKDYVIIEIFGIIPGVPGLTLRTMVWTRASQWWRGVRPPPPAPPPPPGMRRVTWKPRAHHTRVRPPHRPRVTVHGMAPRAELQNPFGINLPRVAPLVVNFFITPPLAAVRCVVDALMAYQHILDPTYDLQYLQFQPVQDEFTIGVEAVQDILSLVLDDAGNLAADILNFWIAVPFQMIRAGGRLLYSVFNLTVIQDDIPTVYIGALLVYVRAGIYDAARLLNAIYNCVVFAINTVDPSLLPADQTNSPLNLDRDPTTANVVYTWGNILVSLFEIVLALGFHIDQLFDSRLRGFNSTTPFLCDPVKYTPLRAQFFSWLHSLGDALASVPDAFAVLDQSMGIQVKMNNCSLPQTEYQRRCGIEASLYAAPGGGTPIGLMECDANAISSGVAMFVDMFDAAAAFVENVIVYGGEGDNTLGVCGATRPDFTQPPQFSFAWAQPDQEAFFSAMGCLAASIIPTPQGTPQAILNFKAELPCAVWSILNIITTATITGIDMFDATFTTLISDIKGDPTNGGLATAIAYVLGKIIDTLEHILFHFANLMDALVPGTGGFFETLRELFADVFTEPQLLNFAAIIQDAFNVMSAFFQMFRGGGGDTFVYALLNLALDVGRMFSSLALQVLAALLQVVFSSIFGQTFATFVINALTCIPAILCTVVFGALNVLITIIRGIITVLNLLFCHFGHGCIPEPATISSPCPPLNNNPCTQLGNLNGPGAQQIACDPGSGLRHITLEPHHFAPRFPRRPHKSDASADAGTFWRPSQTRDRTRGASARVLPLEHAARKHDEALLAAARPTRRAPGAISEDFYWIGAVQPTCQGALYQYATDAAALWEWHATCHASGILLPSLPCEWNVPLEWLLSLPSVREQNTVLDHCIGTDGNSVLQYVFIQRAANASDADASRLWAPLRAAMTWYSGQRPTGLAPPYDTESVDFAREPLTLNSLLWGSMAQFVVCTSGGGDGTSTLVGRIVFESDVLDDSHVRVCSATLTTELFSTLAPDATILVTRQGTSVAAALPMETCYFASVTASLVDALDGYIVVGAANYGCYCTSIRNGNTTLAVAGIVVTGYTFLDVAGDARVVYPMPVPDDAAPWVSQPWCDTSAVFRLPWPDAATGAMLSTLPVPDPARDGFASQFIRPNVSRLYVDGAAEPDFTQRHVAHRNVRHTLHIVPPPPPPFTDPQYAIRDFIASESRPTPEALHAGIAELRRRGLWLRMSREALSAFEPLFADFESQPLAPWLHIMWNAYLVSVWNDTTHALVPPRCVGVDETCDTRARDLVALYNVTSGGNITVAVGGVPALILTDILACVVPCLDRIHNEDPDAASSLFMSSAMSATGVAAFDRFIDGFDGPSVVRAALTAMDTRAWTSSATCDLLARTRTYDPAFGGVWQTRDTADVMWRSLYDACVILRAGAVFAGTSNIIPGLPPDIGYSLTRWGNIAAESAQALYTTWLDVNDDGTSGIPMRLTNRTWWQTEVGLREDFVLTVIDAVIAANVSLAEIMADSLTQSINDTTQQLGAPRAPSAALDGDMRVLQPVIHGLAWGVKVIEKLWSGWQERNMTAKMTGTLGNLQAAGGVLYAHAYNISWSTVTTALMTHLVPRAHNATEFMRRHCDADDAACLHATRHARSRGLRNRPRTDPQVEASIYETASSIERWAYGTVRTRGFMYDTSHPEDLRSVFTSSSSIPFSDLADGGDSTSMVQESNDVACVPGTSWCLDCALLNHILKDTLTQFRLMFVYYDQMVPAFANNALARQNGMPTQTINYREIIGFYRGRPTVSSCYASPPANGTTNSTSSAAWTSTFTATRKGDLTRSAAYGIGSIVGGLVALFDHAAGIDLAASIDSVATTLFDQTELATYATDGLAQTCVDPAIATAANTDTPMQMLVGGLLAIWEWLWSCDPDGVLMCAYRARTPYTPYVVTAWVAVVGVGVTVFILPGFTATLVPILPLVCGMTFMFLQYGYSPGCFPRPPVCMGEDIATWTYILLPRQWEWLGLMVDAANDNATDTFPGGVCGRVANFQQAWNALGFAIRWILKPGASEFLLSWPMRIFVPKKLQNALRGYAAVSTTFVSVWDIYQYPQFVACLGLQLAPIFIVIVWALLAYGVIFVFALVFMVLVQLALWLMAVGELLERDIVEFITVRRVLALLRKARETYLIKRARRHARRRALRATNEQRYARRDARRAAQRRKDHTDGAHYYNASFSRRRRPREYPTS